MFKKNKFIKKYKWWIIFSLIFIIHIFLRFYQLETRFHFGTDQVRMAWIIKGIIVDHVFPLVGPPNKLGSGIYVGPIYYYLISVFYFFTNLDPIAAAFFAGVTSIFSLLVIFYIVRKLFSSKVALMTGFINTISFSGIQFDRMQWEISLIPTVAIVAFYAFYKIINNSEKYLFLLLISLGLAFHIHITVALFLTIITLFTLPLFPKTKKMIKYLPASLVIFVLLLSPLIFENLQTKNVFSGSVFQYFSTSFHGFHLRRIFQLTNDAFIQFESFFTFSYLKLLSLLLLPIFMVVYCRSSLPGKKISICYLIGLFYIIPWLVLSSYRGEITDYYFATNRYLSLFIISYLLIKLLSLKKMFLTVAVSIFIIYYSWVNLNKFFNFRIVSLRNHKLAAQDAIKKGKTIDYHSEKPQAYLYYIYTRKK